MKYFLFTVFFVLANLALGQEAIQLKSIQSSGGFDVESGEPTGETFEAFGISKEVFVTRNGARYVKQKSAKGNMYPLWIYEKVEGDVYIDGEPATNIYITRKGTYAELMLSKSNPENFYWKYYRQEK